MNVKENKLLKGLTLGASALIALYYGVYLMFCIFGLDSQGMAVFAVLVIACVTLPVVFYNSLRRLLGRAFYVVNIIFAALMIFYILTVAFFWCYIGFNSAKTPEKLAGVIEGNGENCVVLVFGCRTYGYTPSLTLKNRLESAYELLEALPEAVCVVSGGQGANETIPEALSMKTYLEEKGIASERIFMESESHSTSENVRFSKELIEREGLAGKNVIGISTSFHMPRVGLLSQRYGLPMELCSSPSPSFGHHYVSMIREYLSYIKMMLFDKAVIITRIV